MLAALLLITSWPQTPTLTVDTTKIVTAISPYVYGSNEDDWDGSGKHLTFGRQGGNRMTAYNWENNASNAGSDWHFQSDNFLCQHLRRNENTPGEFPREAVEDAQAHNASFLVTIPMAGYVAADKKGDGDVNQTPDFIHTRFKKSEPKKGAAFKYPPDLNSDTVYQDEFVWWLEKTFPNRPGGANIWYSLDNEPDLWSSTHARIHPEKATYAEIIQRSVAYCKAIKAVAPKTLIFGPASYGWEGYVHFQDPTDVNGRDFLEYYLTEMKEAGLDSGKRLLDVLDLHWYPEAQGDKTRITEEKTSPALDKARMQATRSLWDPTYVEDSWIAKTLNGQGIDLIPRVQAKIDKCYPGTKLAFTEYQFGAPNHISGAVAQADALGIFGRMGVFAAAMWPYGGKADYVHAAYDAFRNYDGNGAQFGDLALAATSSDPTQVSIYASKFSKSDNKVVCVIVNQSSSDRTFNLSLSGFSPASLRQFTLTSGQPRLVEAHFAGLEGGKVTLHLSSVSVNVLELRS